MNPEQSAPEAGHRAVPHTADLRIEAWAPTREECLSEAVRGVTEAFLDTRDATGVSRREVRLSGETDEDLLVALLEEVIYRFDTADEIPLDVHLAPDPESDRRQSGSGGGSRGNDVRAGFHMADARSLPVVGAVPKAVTLHELAFTQEGQGGWRCSVTLDV